MFLLIVLFCNTALLLAYPSKNDTLQAGKDCLSVKKVVSVTSVAV